MSNLRVFPVTGPAFDALQGRAGDWREPVVVHLADESAECLTGWTQSHRIPVDLAVGLAFERAALLALLAEEGIRPKLASELLNAATAQAERDPAVGPGRRQARYALFLRSGDRQLRQEPCIPGARECLLPARLIPWARVFDPNAIIDSGSLDEAINWEIASTQRQLLMTEWGLAAALGAVRSSLLNR